MKAGQYYLNRRTLEMAQRLLMHLCAAERRSAPLLLVDDEPFYVWTPDDTPQEVIDHALRVALDRYDS